MWLSATKEVPMKDYKPKVINVTNNIRATIYPNGDFDISFLYDENRRWDFEFSKYNRIKQRVCTDGKTFKPITDLADNWKVFKFCLNAKAILCLTMATSYLVIMLKNGLMVL